MVVFLRVPPTEVIRRKKEKNRGTVSRIPKR
jgi:hypothetical protein